jgi:hypothetical protein
MLLKFLSIILMKAFLILAVMIVSGINVSGQNLIGYKYGEIRKYMKENASDMNFNDVINKKYKYLKYTDSADSQTLMFFLDEDSVCSSVRLTCDAAIKAAKVKEFDSRYKKKGENRWIEKRGRKKYLIELKNEKWSSVITIEPEK